MVDVLDGVVVVEVVDGVVVVEDVVVTGIVVRNVDGSLLTTVDVVVLTEQKK